MDLSKFYAFPAFCQTKPRISLTKISKLVKASPLNLRCQMNQSPFWNVYWQKRDISCRITEESKYSMPSVCCAFGNNLIHILPKFLKFIMLQAIQLGWYMSFSHKNLGCWLIGHIYMQYVNRPFKAKQVLHESSFLKLPPLSISDLCKGRLPKFDNAVQKF